VTALALAPTLFDAAPAVRDDAPSMPDALGGEPTLDDLLVGAWEGLTAHKSVACLVCGESMGPEYGAHALPIGGKCGGCGTRLT
jgi:hypothetical protein